MARRSENRFKSQEEFEQASITNFTPRVLYEGGPLTYTFSEAVTEERWGGAVPSRHQLTAT